MPKIKAAVAHEFNKPLIVEDIMLRLPFNNEVEVTLGAVAICHSDISYMEGAWGGFLPAVYFSGSLKVNYKYNLFVRLILNFLLFTFSVSFIYIFGLIWLSRFVPMEQLWMFGVKPFLLAELFKVLILSVGVTILNKDVLSWRSFR